MKLHEIISGLAELAPEHLAESWDRVGLHVAFGNPEVRQALLCIDLTEPVIDEAIGAKVDLIVAYHPPIFKPLAALTDGDAKQRIVLRAIRAGIAIYSPHTALDAAEGGVNDWLASGLGVGQVRSIRPHQPAKQCKFVTFVPEEAADRVRTALSEAGAGQIGNYSQCSFNIPGEGTFLGDESTQPAVGRTKQFERVPEIRLEMVLPVDRLTEAVAALRRSHPYEEPPIDVYPMLIPESAASAVGQGRIVELQRAISLNTLVQRLKQHLGVKTLEVAPAQTRKPIRRIGLCAGAGGSLLSEAGPIDAFITGEMRHHDVLAATTAGTAIILAGHTQTERPYLKTYRQRLRKQLGGKVEWRISRADRAPSAIR